tara:strand:- start:5629 stop:6258 length:630 start_codon:yes stop_codon:yes gene_type:complete
MSYPTTGSKAELQAINQILMSVGQAPVTTLERTNPDVAICWDTLTECSREVQSEGWTFNREYDYPMTPNENKNIVYPANVLQMDISNNPEYYTGKQYDTVKRDGKLYDRRAHSYEFTETIYCDIKWLFAWEDLPTPIQDYITAKAATMVSNRIVGDPNQYQILQQNEGYTRAMALEYETNQGDYSFFGFPRRGTNYVSYRPYQAMNRIA